MKIRPYAKNDEFAKVDGHTVAAQTPGTKQVKQQFLNMRDPAEIGFAPPSRLYSQDYRYPMDTVDSSGQDIVTQFLGNPLVW